MDVYDGAVVNEISAVFLENHRKKLNFSTVFPKTAEFISAVHTCTIVDLTNSSLIVSSFCISVHVFAQRPSCCTPVKL